MIKINLAARKQAVGTTSGSKVTGLGSFHLDLGNLGGALERFKDAELHKPLRKALLPVIVAVLASFTVDSFKASEVKKVDEQLATVNAKKPPLQAEIAKSSAYEELKKSLEADEFTIRTKIETIQKLVEGRGIGSKILISLAASMPDHVWLSDFRIKDSQAAILGYSLNMGEVSDFMKVLGESAYFTDLNLKSSQQVKGEQGSNATPGGGEITSFELAAKRK
ncbi:MAG: PilN domain-containing protein [Oligoflexia bacterium]|nr:PilN domain-containing protein [Oligoflexia bacterium]